MRTGIVVIAVGLQFLVALDLQAPLPPETLNLREIKQGRQPMDEDLAAWFEQVENRFEPLDLEQEKFASWVSNLPPASRAYWQMRRRDDTPDDKRTQWLTSQADVIKENLDDSTWRNDPLFPQLLYRLVDEDDVPEKQRGRFAATLKSFPGKTCSHKELVQHEIYDNTVELTVTKVKELLLRIQRFRSKRFQERALESLLVRLDQDKHGSLRPLLAELVKPFPGLVADHEWLLGQDDKKAQQKREEEPFASFDRAEEYASERRCRRARRYLIRAMKRDKKATHFAITASLVPKVETCYKWRGNRARLNFLNSVRRPLKKAYGFPGEELVLRSKGLTYWGRDEFDKARKIFTYLLKTARARNHTDIEARTLYTFARVDENEGRLTAAMQKYKQFIKNFPEDEKVNESLISLVVLSSMVNSQNEALGFAKLLIERETMKAIEHRETSTLGFALFWAGKLNLTLGRPTRSFDYWRRLASEYYSTFYGSLGHYMLETLSQRRFTLPPYQVPEFDLPKLQQRFPPEGRQQLQRIDQLLAQGLRSEAACEIRELAVATDDEDQQLVKVLYLYASGEWLQAIKSYNRLSRPFRHSLPRGMERLLFPRRYVDLVRKYAQRLKVPEEFVYSIIRQESVFNPRALSVVGASGLMQLMPATARLEARRLSRGYVSGRSRRQLIRHSRRQSHLFDAETNITLGTHHVFHLFQRYKNPIFVLTAYNANPRATEKWQKNLDTSDMLAFVERIPYRETRAYVKLVMRNYFYYNRWYRSVDQEMPFMEYLAPKMVALARRQPLKDIPWSTQ